MNYLGAKFKVKINNYEREILFEVIFKECRLINPIPVFVVKFIMKINKS